MKIVENDDNNYVNSKGEDSSKDGIIMLLYVFKMKSEMVMEGKKYAIKHTHEKLNIFERLKFYVFIIPE